MFQTKEDTPTALVLCSVKLLMSFKRSPRYTLEIFFFRLNLVISVIRTFEKKKKERINFFLSVFQKDKMI